MDHHLQDFLLGGASCGLPTLRLNAPLAHAPLAAPPIGNDLDVVTLLERPAEPILEMRVRSAHDQEHSRWVVQGSFRHTEDGQDECGNELNHEEAQSIRCLDLGLTSCRTT